MAFQGFGEKALPFLKALDFHQDRDWFRDNRDLYESELNRPRGDLIEELTARFAAEGLPFKGDRKKSLFRIYRDIRFSKDKRPFNTHVSILLSFDGTKRPDGCFYCHVGLTERFMGVAFYQPQPDALKRLRTSIVEWPGKYRDMLAALEKNGLVLDEGDALKRLPRDFEGVADADLSAGVRRRYFMTRQDIDPERITSPALADDCVDFARRALPLFDWGIGCI